MLPKIIGLVGSIRSGKTFAANYLKQKYGYRIASNSDVLREIARNLGMAPDRENLKRIGDSIFSVIGNDAIARFRLREQLAMPIVVDGIRYREELEAYSLEPSFRLLGLQAKEELRYARAMALAYEGKDQNIERTQFNRLVLARSEAQVEGLVLSAHVVINNDSGANEFQESLDRVMKNWSTELSADS
jgi:dephospho-CoA kinase